MGGLLRLVDRPAAALGAVATGLAWVVGVSPLAGLAIGGVTVAVASAGVALERNRSGSSTEERSIPAPVLHADEERWIRRGAEAVSMIDGCVHWLAEGALRERLSDVAGQARGVLDDLQTLAAQAGATRVAGRQLDAARLTSELTRLTTKLDQSTGPDLEDDLRRSVEAVREQLGVHRRLETARKVLHGRIESGSLGLQQLAAQVCEMTALAGPDTFAQQGRRIDELNTQLEGLRAGLTHAGALSRRALGEMETEGGHDVPAVP